MDVTCLLSALLFFLSNSLFITLYIREHGRGHFDYDKWRQLDPEYIEQEWDFRVSHAGLHTAAGVLNAFAWLAFCFPILQLAWIISRKGTRSLGLHTTIVVVSLTGAFTEWMARFLWIGSTLATNLLVSQFNLDDWIDGDNEDGDGIGWRVLEIAHITTVGLIWFVDAFEWLAISVLMLLIYVSLRGWRASSETNFYVPPGGSADQAVPIFGGCQHHLALFISLLSLLDFISEILRIDGFRLFGQVAFWYAVVNRLLFIPFWLVLLGRKLPLAASKLPPDNSLLANSHLSSNGNTPGETVDVSGNDENRTGVM